MSTPLSKLRSARLDTWHHILRAWWIYSWIILLVVGISLGAALLYISATPVLYKLTAVVPLGSQPEVASESLPEFREMGWANTSLLRNKDFVADAVPAHLGYQAAELASRIIVATDASTKTVTLSLTDRYPKNARLALEDLLKHYLVHLGAELAKRRSQIIERVEADLEVQKAELAAAEKAYRDSINSIVGSDTSLLADQPIEPILPKLQSTYEAALAEEERWKQAYESIAELEGNATALLEVPDIANHSSILFVKNRIREQEALRQTLIEKDGPEQPAVLQVGVKIEEQNRVLKDAALQFPSLLKGRYDRAVAARTRAQEALQEHEAIVRQLETEGRDPQTLARILGDKRALFAGSTQRLKELNEAQRQGVDQPALIRVSFLADEEIKLPVNSILTWTAGISITAGLLLAWIVFLASPKVRTVEEIERASGLRVLATVARDGAVAQLSTRALEQRPSDSPAFEAFRTLRSVLPGQGSGATLILVTGVRGGEGTSTIAANLAASFAGSGLRTLLVDLNLRRPAQSAAIFGAKVQPGVTDFALGIDSLDQLVRPAVDRLEVLPAGRAVPNPGELMGYAWFQNFSDEVRNRYQIVVLDAPAVLEFGDVLPVAAAADHTVLVARSGRTSILQLIKAGTTLTDAGGRVDGVILNFAR
jgi:capsular exopolysaccharide synthesis family protein